MAAVAELLRVPVPVDYQLSRPTGPERSSLALLAGVRVPLTQVGERILQVLKHSTLFTLFPLLSFDLFVIIIYLLKTKANYLSF